MIKYHSLGASACFDSIPMPLFLLLMMTHLGTWVEVVHLPPFVPTEAERGDAGAFAARVRLNMSEAGRFGAGCAMALEAKRNLTEFLDQGALVLRGMRMDKKMK